MIYYKIGGMKVDVELKQFKDGCMNVDINTGSRYPEFRHKDILVGIQFGGKYSINDMIFALGLTVDALKTAYPSSTLSLRMPYLPYARQDRACSPGEAFSARFAAQTINGMGFAYIGCLDPHSGVMGGLYKNLYVTDQFDMFKEIYPTWHDVYLVAPDAGALKKCEEFAKYAGAAGVLVCHKERNMKTIEITEHVLLTKPTFRMGKFLVLDDICDGGRTFVSAKKAVKVAVEQAGGRIDRMDLAVTHGLFTYGVDVVANEFDNVYTTDSYASNRQAHNVKVLSVW